MRTQLVVLSFLTVAAAAAAPGSPGARHPHLTRGHTARAATPSAEPNAPAGRTVTITARDYAFEAPDTVAAGRTAVRLVNRGRALHHASIIRLEGGKTMGDFFAALRVGGPPRWAHDVGGPGASMPDGELQVTLDLVPGRYLITCFISAGDGVPHMAKGMARELVVVPGGTAARRAHAAAAAAPRTTITLVDYDFALSRPLTAGRQTVRVRNAGPQPHEIALVRLAPGKRVADVIAWARTQEGPPPGVPLAGTTAMAYNEWNDLLLDLEPGEYGLLCFARDVKDGRSHVAHGMVKEISVR